VHVGEFHAAFDFLGDYAKDDEDLKVILTNMKLTSWVLYVATELVFVEFLARPRYWKIVARHEGGTRVEVSYEPDEQVQKWQAEYLGAQASV
jgi:hypothetical protein